MRSIEPGISRFRAWSFGPSRNDGESGSLRRFSRLAMTVETGCANGKESKSGWSLRGPMPVRQRLFRDRHAGALGLARSFAWQPARAWRGLCDLCRKLAQAFSHHEGRGYDRALRGQGNKNPAQLLCTMRHATVLRTGAFAAHG